MARTLWVSVSAWHARGGILQSVRFLARTLFPAVQRLAARLLLRCLRGSAFGHSFLRRRFFCGRFRVCLRKRRSASSTICAAVPVRETLGCSEERCQRKVRDFSASFSRASRFRRINSSCPCWNNADGNNQRDGYWQALLKSFPRMFHGSNRSCSSPPGRVHPSPKANLPPRMYWLARYDGHAAPPPLGAVMLNCMLPRSVRRSRRTCPE